MLYVDIQTKMYKMNNSNNCMVYHTQDMYNIAPVDGNERGKTVMSETLCVHSPSVVTSNSPSPNLSYRRSRLLPQPLLRCILLFLSMLIPASVLAQTPVSTASDLAAVSGSSASFVIVADIDASTLNSIASFSGTLEAAINPATRMPYRITNLRAPLFSTLTGTVRNLVLESVAITQSGRVGAIAATANGTARIYNVGILSGSVGSTNNYCGGLVGLLDGSARVLNCYSYADITGGTDVGGIVGYNNVATTAATVATGTMVMNCMFYGDITGGTTVSPVFGGNNIANLQGGLNTFNYYAYDKLKSKTINSYNCALAIEERFLTRFEFYRLLLNSNKKLAAWYATTSSTTVNPSDMLKWVLETADRTIANPKPYPILKAQGYYPSIINPDIANAPDSATVGRKHGGKLPSPRQTLAVTIRTTKSDGGQSWPSGASITTASITLTRTDMDGDRYNFNYDKVQLPYYNDIGTGNYTEQRVVTGWKIVSMETPTGYADPYTSDNYDYSQTYASTPAYFDYPNYNFADRKSVNKDLYAITGRIFPQGAYFDVPYGVTSITIEPYWGKAVYIGDAKLDVVYTNGYGTPTAVAGAQYTNGTSTFNGQIIYTTTFNNNGTIKNTAIANALSAKVNNQTVLNGSTVYDNAIVLVGNLHQASVPSNGATPFTIMSVDEDNDHEPDYSLIYHHTGKLRIAPIRFDFLNVIGTAQAQKPNGANNICNTGILHPKGWFEITNTSLMYFSQLEYEDQVDNSDMLDHSPLILHGGIIEQIVSANKNPHNGKTIYVHLGGNVWFKEFNIGIHGDGSNATPHVPVSVTGGDYKSFYLTGIYNPNATPKSDNAECYISGGHFGEAAGAGQEQIDGNVRWQIYNADIDNFFGGGINDNKPIKGTVATDIYNSHIDLFCGGPKFGNMQPNKNVTTNAVGCVFGTFFGAGYGGNSYSRVKFTDATTVNWSSWDDNYVNERGIYFNGSSTAAPYGKKGKGVATDFDYEFFVWSSGLTGGRFYVKYATFSLAQCNKVSSSLKKCTINNNFYGGGSLGMVTDSVTSVLDSCTVNGDVYGAGFSATLPTIWVRDGGFVTTPNYNKNSGLFEPAVFSDSTEFHWENHSLTDNSSGIDESGAEKKIYTNVDLDALGTVEGNITLTLKGTTSVSGSIYGGGEESAVLGDTRVLLKGNTLVRGDVYGGGNQGRVDGDTSVEITD